jgi:hypothetical protein
MLFLFKTAEETTVSSSGGVSESERIQLQKVIVTL